MSFVNKPLTDIMDCTRASTATYVDATGKIRTAGVNEPRIDFSSGQGRLLVEEARTNLLTWSEDFSKSSWTPEFSGRVYSYDNQDITPPKEYAKITKVVIGSSGSIDRRSFRQPIPNLNGTCTQSVYIYVPSGQGFSEYGLRFVFGIADTTVSSNVFDRWHRLHLTSTVDTTSISFGLTNAEGSGVIFNSIFYVSCAQVEQGATPSSYIPTEDSAVTRAADNVSRVLGDEFNQEQWTWCTEFNPYKMRNPAAGISLLGLGNPALGFSSTSNVYFSYAAGSSGLSLNTPFQSTSANNLVSSVEDRVYKITISYDGERLRSFVDGVKVNDRAVSKIEGISWLKVGSPWSTGVSNRTFDTKKLRFYPKALSDIECEELTRI